MRLIDADALIVELEKDEAFFDKEAEEARENPNSCTEGYADAMWSRANGIRDAMIEIYDAPTIEPKTKVIAQVIFDEDKVREIVHEAVERIKEEYDIVDNPDAVSVVRCKECKHGSDNKIYGCALIDYNTDEYHRMYADDYCSYGERKGE